MKKGGSSYNDVTRLRNLNFTCRGGKVIKRLGIVLIILGILVLIGYSLYSLLSVADVPAVIKGAIVAVILGLIVLIAALAVERLKDIRDEENKY